MQKHVITVFLVTSLRVCKISWGTRNIEVFVFLFFFQSLYKSMLFSLLAHLWIAIHCSYASDRAYLQRWMRAFWWHVYRERSPWGAQACFRISRLSSLDGGVCCDSYLPVSSVVPSEWYIHALSVEPTLRMSAGRQKQRSVAWFHISRVWMFSVLLLGQLLVLLLWENNLTKAA